jgi:hypothetical protein
VPCGTTLGEYRAGHFRGHGLWNEYRIAIGPPGPSAPCETFVRSMLCASVYWTSPSGGTVMRLSPK